MKFVHFLKVAAFLVATWGFMLALTKANSFISRASDWAPAAGSFIAMGAMYLWFKVIIWLFIPKSKEQHEEHSS